MLPFHLLALCSVGPATPRGAQPTPIFELGGPQLVQLMANGRPAAIKFVDSTDASAAQPTAQVDATFAQLAREFGMAGNPVATTLQFVSVDCAAHADACATRKVEKGSGPVIKYWTGESFRRYTGKLDVTSVRDYLARKLLDAAEKQPPAQPAPRRQERSADGRSQIVWHENDLSLTLASTWALMIALFFLGRWLSGEPAAEAPGTFLLIGSASTPGARWPHACAKTGALSVVRLDEAVAPKGGKKGAGALQLTPLSRVPLPECDLSELCVAARKRNGALLLHTLARAVPSACAVPSTRAEGKDAAPGAVKSARGGAAVVEWDPRVTPCASLVTYALLGQVPRTRTISADLPRARTISADLRCAHTISADLPCARTISAVRRRSPPISADLPCSPGGAHDRAAELGHPRRRVRLRPRGVRRRGRAHHAPRPLAARAAEAALVAVLAAHRRRAPPSKRGLPWPRRRRRERRHERRRGVWCRRRDAPLDPARRPRHGEPSRRSFHGLPQAIPRNFHGLPWSSTAFRGSFRGLPLTFHDLPRPSQLSTRIVAAHEGAKPNGAKHAKGAKGAKAKGGDGGADGADDGAAAQGQGSGERLFTTLDGRFHASHLLVADAASEEVRQYALPPEGTVGEYRVRSLGSLQLAAGCGPCALATHPSAALAYVLCALEGSVLVLELEPSTGHRPSIDLPPPFH